MLQQRPPEADGPLPDSLSLMQLLQLSLKTPDYGVVNFRSLYVLLEHLLNRMNIASDQVNLSECPSRELIREAGRGMDDGEMRNMTGVVVDYRDGSGIRDNSTGGTGGGGGNKPFHAPSIASFDNQQRIAALEQKVGTLRLQLEVFQAMPSNGRLVEKAEVGQPGRFTFNIFEANKPGSLAAAEIRSQSLADPTGQASQMRLSGPMNEAWQVMQLSKRMDAAEQALEKAFRLIDEILQGLGSVKTMKENLVNYIRKWMLNPEGAFHDALNGNILGDAPVEDFVVPASVNKLPFVTWPALRSVLVDRQNDDAKPSMMAGPRARSPSGSSQSLTPITERKEKLSEASKISSPRLADDNTSTRFEEEKNSVSIGTNRSTPASQQSDRSRHSRKSGSTRRHNGSEQADVTTEAERQSAKQSADGARSGAGKEVDETVLSSGKDAAGLDGANATDVPPDSQAGNPSDVQKITDSSEGAVIDAEKIASRVGEDSDGAGLSDDDRFVGARDRNNLLNIADGSNSSSNRSSSTRRSTPLSLISAPSRTPRLNEMRLSGSPHTDSPTFVLEPDADVLDSLVHIGRLVRTSDRFEKRLARIEAYLNGLAHKKDINRMTQGLRNDMDDFRRSLSMVAPGGLPGRLGAELQPEDGTNVLANGYESINEYSDNERARMRGSQTQPGIVGADYDGTNRVAGSLTDGVPFLSANGADPLSQAPMSDGQGRQSSAGAGGMTFTGVDGTIPPGGTVTAAVDGRPGSAGAAGGRLGSTGAVGGFGGRTPPLALSPLSGLDQGFRSVGSADRMATLDHVLELQKVLASQHKNWERMQNRVNTLHRELASVTTNLKEQAIKLACTSSRVLINTQFQQDLTPELASAGHNGPTRSEFEIFCRACAENFEMIEVRLTDLENIIGTQQSKIEALQFQTNRIQREKINELSVVELLAPKADLALLDNKLDKPHFMEFANILQQKLMDMRSSMLQQGDYFGNNIKNLSERLETLLNSGDVERKVEEIDKHIDQMGRRLMVLEKFLHVDEAAGSKKPIREYTCVSCDRPVDPTPNERLSGWPHAYVTPTVRPYLEYIKHQMVQNWDGNKRIGELKYQNVSLGKRFQRHLREQECLEFKQAANHFGNISYPHCNHNENRPVGGKHTLLNNQDYHQSTTKPQRKCIGGRLDSFVKRNSFQIQIPRTAKDEIFGFPDMRVGQLRKPRSADNLVGGGRAETRKSCYDARHLQAGIQRRASEKKKRTATPLAIESPRPNTATLTAAPTRQPEPLATYPGPRPPTVPDITPPENRVFDIKKTSEGLGVPDDTTFASAAIGAFTSSAPKVDPEPPLELLNDSI